MKRICITGPESTGKSALAKALAHHYQCPWVAEFSREYLGQLGRPYRREDLDAIAAGQCQAEAAVPPDSSASYLFCDTGPEVVYVWSHYKYGGVSPQVELLTATTRYHHTLLLDVDIPWQPDPLRETPALAARSELLRLYQNLLTRLGRPWSLISGRGALRRAAARHVLETLG